MSNNYTCVSINEYFPDINAGNEQIIDHFLTNDNFKHADFHAVIRFNEGPNKFLGHALNLDKISHSDFKIFSKLQILEFFDKSVPKDSIHKIDQEDRHLLEKFISFLSQTPTDKFYLISRDFFDLSIGKNAEMIDERLLFDMTIYNPYHLLIWFDKNILNVCEYLAD